MNINTEQIRELAELAIEKGLAELTVEDGDKSVTIKLPGSAAYQVMPQPMLHAGGHAPGAPVVSSHIPPVEAEKPAAADDDKLFKITSPMVGTFYAAPSPDSPPYVAVGASISKGQAVCIIEAMKMMNELESEVSGKVVKILAENGQPVEFGQVIMLVEPS